MKRSDLIKKNLGELKKIAKKEGVKGYSKYRKSDIPELVDLILKNNKQQKKKSSKKKSPKKKSLKKKSSKKVQYSNVILPGYTKTLSEMKVPELKSYAKQEGIKLSSKDTKNVIIKKIGKNIGKVENIKKKSVDLKLPLTKEQVKGMTKIQMIQILKNNGVEKGLPSKKTELASLLQKNKCSPIKKEFCDDNDVCDIRNNICMSPSFQKRGLIKIKIDGKEIIGTKKAIENLKKQMKESPVRDLIDEEDDNIEINDNQEDNYIENGDIEDILKGVGDMNIDDGPMEFESSDDEVDVVDVDVDTGRDLQNLGIKESLEEIQEPEKQDNIKNISEVQREVLKCLGML